MMTYLFVATSVFWVGLFLWVYTAIHRSQVKIQSEITDLKRKQERF